jgi:hypothetical protein
VAGCDRVSAFESDISRAGGLIPALPKPSEQPNRIMGGAPGRDEAGEMYWFVEAITSRQVIEASRPNAVVRVHTGDLLEGG